MSYYMYNGAFQFPELLKIFEIYQHTYHFMLITTISQNITRMSFSFTAVKANVICFERVVHVVDQYCEFYIHLVVKEINDTIQNFELQM